MVELRDSSTESGRRLAKFKYAFIFDTNTPSVEDKPEYYKGECDF